jgi:hypothetical protein
VRKGDVFDEEELVFPVDLWRTNTIYHRGSVISDRIQVLKIMGGLLAREAYKVDFLHWALGGPFHYYQYHHSNSIGFLTYPETFLGKQKNHDLIFIIDQFLLHFDLHLLSSWPKLKEKKKKKKDEDAIYETQLFSFQQFQGLLSETDGLRARESAGGGYSTKWDRV